MTTIQPEDQLIIIANQGLWKYISYQEAVDEIINIPDPVLAAKKLQDLAQGYRSVENIGVLVIRFLVSAEERNRLRELLQTQFENEQALVAELRLRDIEREEMRKKAELEELDENVPMDIVKLKGARKRKMANSLFSNGVNGESDDEIDDIEIKPFPNSKDPTANWETVLQQRLTEEVKNKELIYAMRMDRAHETDIDADENWTSKSKGVRTVTLPPAHKKHAAPAPPPPPPPPQPARRQIIPEAAQLSTESLEFQRELKHPLNVDRDAVLFHQMQLTRSKSHHISTDSIDSTQSDPAYMSIKEISSGPKSSSHSIEVLLHGVPDLKYRKDLHMGGSHKFPTEFSAAKKKHSLSDSCPIDIPMSERLKMLENKGFLPKDATIGKHEKNDNQKQMQDETNMDEIDKGQKLVLNETQKGVKGEVQKHKDELQKNDKDDRVISQKTVIDKQKPSVSVEQGKDQVNIRELHNKNVKAKENFDHGTNIVDEYNDEDDDSCSVTSTDSFSYVMHNDVYIEKPFGDSDSGNSNEDINTAGKEYNAISGMKQVNLVKLEGDYSVLETDSVDSTAEIMIMGPDKTDDPSGLYSTVKKVRKPELTNSHSPNANSKGTSGKQNGIVTKPKTDNLFLHKKDDSFDSGKVDLKSRESPKEAPSKVPDINSNSIKSLEDLLAYNRMHQQKFSYKHHPKVAPPPPASPQNGKQTHAPPLTSMVSKTPSQRSIIITYL